MVEVAHSLDPWHVDSDWSDTITDHVILETDHCRVVEHRAAQAGMWGSHAGYGNDWTSTSFPVKGAFVVKGRPIDVREPGAIVRQTFAPHLPMRWSPAFSVMMKKCGETGVHWQYFATDTPTIWRCLYLHVKTCGLYWPEGEDIRQEVYGAGDVVKAEGGALIVFLDARIDSRDAVTESYTGTHLLDEGDLRRFKVLSGTVYVVYPNRKEA